MNNEKLVSIIMATYNGEPYINEQIESILGQTYSCFELIIIDDNSSDGTMNILSNYSSKDHRIRVFKNEVNLGCCDTFVTGIEKAKGKYVALCDQDDVWRTDKLEILVKNVSTHALVYSNCNIIDSDGKVVNNSYKNLNPLIGKDSNTDDFNLITFFNSFILGCSMLIEKSALDKVFPIMDKSHNHDKWIAFRLSEIGTVCYVDDLLFSYRIHGRNLSIREKSDFASFILRKFSKSTVPISFDLSVNYEHCDSKLLNEVEFDTFAGRLFSLLKYGSFMYLRDKGFKRRLLILNWILRGS